MTERSETPLDYLHGTTVRFAADTWQCGKQLRVSDTYSLLGDADVRAIEATPGPWRSCVYVEHGTSKIARLVTWAASRAMPDPDDDELWRIVRCDADSLADMFGVFDAAAFPATTDGLAALDAAAGALTDVAPHFATVAPGVAVAPSRGTGLLSVLTTLSKDARADGVCLEFEYLDSAL